MAFLDPPRALHTCETVLRQLLDTIFRDQIGEDWLDQLSNAAMRRQWSMAAAADKAVRDVAGLATWSSMLAYTRFEDLVVMARKQWNSLEPVLGSQCEMGPLLNRVASYRNDVAHSRMLPPFASDLLSGIAGELQNRVVRFMSTQDETGQYFPRIIEARDSLLTSKAEPSSSS